MAFSPFTVKAVFEYKSPHEDDLNFPVGQIVTVTEQEDDDWYVGEYSDASGVKQSGLFPKNFVERYEPEAPPRPSRPRPKKEGSSAAVPTSTATQPAPLSPPVEPEPQPEEPAAESTPPAPEPAPAAQSVPATAAPPTSSEPSAPSPRDNVPPPVAEKPSSFKDRLALFNKASAAPVAPVKPGGPPTGNTSGFIKKPFVAPPPSRNAYVPPPSRELAPQKVYRREEDPEIAQRQAQDLEDAKSAGLIASEAQDGEEESAKPTSLRDRIALLQKQQQEQASRRAEVAQKEKPKRPPKKRTDSGDPTMESETPELEKITSSDVAAPRLSTDSAQEATRPPLPRKSSPPPQESAQDILSDGNEADQSGAGDTTEDQDEAESTEVEDVNEKAKVRAPQPIPRTSTGGSSRSIPLASTEPTAATKASNVVDEEQDEDDEEEEEEEIDEETRRKMELRERMAKMSGGYGMPGMFAMPMPAAAPKKKRPSGSEEPATSPPPPIQRTPLVPIPGMSQDFSQEPMAIEPEVEKEPESARTVTAKQDPRVVEDVEDLEQQPRERAAPPPPTQDRPLPAAPASSSRSAPPVPVLPTESRPVPPPPPRPAAAQPEADNEIVPSVMATENKRSSRAVPPIPGDQGLQSKPEAPRSPPPSARRGSSMSETTIPSSPPLPAPAEKRTSRPLPPPPGAPSMPPAPPGEARPPPPPPPIAAPPSRRSTGLEEPNKAQGSDADDGESDYEGDYDTDIASGATHKNALKAHAREPSTDDGALSEDTSKPPAMPPVPPPAHRGAPPPPPPQEVSAETRRSVEAPRAPPPAPPRETEITQSAEDYDPYRYSNPTHGILPTHRKTRASQFPAAQQESDPALYTETSVPVDRAPPSVPQSPPQPSNETQRQSREAPRISMDPSRASMTTNRKSTEMPRGSSDQGYMAQDVDLAIDRVWWANPNTTPPAFWGRPDILCEFEESSTSKRGGRTTISKDIYILFPDYSQTVIAARFDPKAPSDAVLEQRHEPPPARPRQDQLEDAHSKIGQAVSSAAGSKQNTTVGDGTAQALVVELLKTQQNTLMPVGTRAYGALVYANMANATVQQFDEIRPGDIISFKNAKFSGKHGAMHAKYSEDVGKPEHVGIVTEWDGTKKKVRALEQGRESRKAKVESFRVGDLRSGEVKVWRVMDRSWVGWESS